MVKYWIKKIPNFDENSTKLLEFSIVYEPDKYMMEIVKILEEVSKRFDGLSLNFITTSVSTLLYT
jgi:hypothetical protein